MRFLHPDRCCLALILALLLADPAFAQEADTTPSALEQGMALLHRSKPEEAEKLLARLVAADSLNADAHFYLALSLSLQGRFEEARLGFERVLAINPRRADACFELAGTYLKTKEYKMALSWARNGLQISARDPYGLELTGTLYFLADSKIEALRYWNRLQRPSLTMLDIRLKGSSNRQRIAETIRLVPGDLLSAREVDRAQWRLQQQRYIRAVKFTPVPGATPYQYSLEVEAETRKGVGSLPEFLFNSFSNVAFRTVRFTYWDIAGSGVTAGLLGRWRPDARWTRADFDVPRPLHLPVHAGVYFDWRDESWYLSGHPDQPQRDFRFRAHEAGVNFLLPLRIPQLSLTAGVSGRRRAFDPSESGTLTGKSAAGSSDLNRLNYPAAPREDAREAYWLRLRPVAQLLRRGSTAASGIESMVRGGLDVGRSRNPARQSHSRLTVSWESRYDWVSRKHLQRSLLIGAHAGRLSQSGLVEDHFVLGVGPDSDFWLRAHPFLRNGRPGRSPLAAGFALGNLTAATDIKRWKWVRLGILAFFDAARLRRVYAGQATKPTMLDFGVGVELGSQALGTRRFAIVWGHDGRTGRDALYITSSFR